MKNQDLAKDYIKRAEIRLSAIEVLLKMESWADVVREAQESIELALKALLRHFGIEFPRIHDVSQILVAEKDRLPKSLDIERLAAISKDLRRDREISFYGSEDLTPSDFYDIKDAQKALDGARYTVLSVKPHIF
ncbi:MAG: HEPN domain-containing protein [Proteobacteria bacterium]|nr:HEPN domain-containing protein [Pseudomonadota bacterium]